MSSSHSLLGRAFQSEALARFVVRHVGGAYIVAWTELDTRDRRTGQPISFYSPVTYGNVPGYFKWTSKAEA